MRFRAFAVAALLLLSLGVSASPASAQEAPEPADYVDPMIGTLGSGFVFPGPAAPYGMVQLSPDTDGYFAYTGYLYSDSFIRGFSHHHIESMGVRSNGDLPFMPTIGPVTSNDPRMFWSHFNHGTEVAEPGYYKVLLDTYGITAELTAGERVGMHRYTFPPSPQANVILDIGRSNQGWLPYDTSGVHGSSLEVVDDQTVVGTADTNQGYSIHFAARFDRPFTGFGAWDAFGDSPVAGKSSASGNGAGGYVTFDSMSDQDVLIKVGTSFVSRDNAVLNLDTEKPDWDFGALRNKTRGSWNDALNTIQVSGGTDADKTSFYTSLYHAQHHPNIFSDVNGEYMGQDDRVHATGGHEHYANFSLWDTYRGENQLLATIQPERYRDMMLSLLDIYDQAGRFPQWAMNDELPDYMVGDPVQQTIVDGYCRGTLDGLDLERFYTAMKHQATDVRRSWNADYLDKGFVSLGPSETLEYALADFSLALFADALGHEVDRDQLVERAKNYLNVLDPETRFVRPRHGDGTWYSPYFPEAPDHFVEGTGWQYSWLVPHDLAGLFAAMGEGNGGIDLVRERLDTFFSVPASEHVPYVVPEAQKHITAFGIAYAGNQYAPSNEHDLHAPYLYDYAGQPWKTQAIVRGYQGLYRPTPDGLPGNDDLGSMSAWYAWSALGLYPVTAGAPVYAVGSPVFEEAVIRPAGTDDEVTISAPGASLVGKYIQSAKLGGADLNRPWITHDELFANDRVTFEMGPLANQGWGSDPSAAPPSLSTSNFGEWGCPRQEKQATSLTYTGDTSGRGSTVRLAARLTTADGAPLAGAPLSFEIAGQNLSSVTIETGEAEATANLSDHGRTQTVTVRYAGDAQHEPSQTSAVITWGKGKK